jgi:glycosyltransferase involved in cell wall biosynthesis
MVACFKPQKSPVDFIDVAARVLGKRRDVHFVMAGDGELRPEIEARVAQHGIGDHVTLLGWASDMPEVYRNLDIFVLTSLWEGQPCVFAEAMAGGLPIVATGADGAREAIVDGVSGYVHEPHDVESIANSVLELVERPELRESMGGAGRARVDEFDIDRSVLRLEEAYSDVLADRQPEAVLTTQP